MNKNNFFDNINFYSLTFMFIIDFVLIVFIHSSWNVTVNTLHPMHKEITNLRNELSEAHLWLEEALGGDNSIDIQKDVLIPFKHEKFNHFIKNTLTNEYIEIKNEFMQINTKLDLLYNLAQKRWENATIGGIGSKLDQNFDKEFTTILSMIDKTIGKINLKTIETIDEKNYHFNLIVAFLIFINLLLFVLFYQVKKYKDKLKGNETTLIHNAKLASMGEMLENIAHQWRQPLNLISTGTTSLKIKHDLGNLNDKYFDEVIESINKNVQYLSQTINDFSNFAKRDKENVIFNLKDNIFTLMKLIESSLKTYKIEPILNIKDDIDIKSYPNELNQVLMNLYNNTKDAFKEKSDLKSKKYIFISTYTKDTNAVIEFKDSAGGIDEKIIDKIFEPYFTTKHKTEGTGLGLHMCYNIVVNSMKGTIQVENENFNLDSKDLKGAKFTITIPINLD